MIENYIGVIAVLINESGPNLDQMLHYLFRFEIIKIAVQD